MGSKKTRSKKRKKPPVLTSPWKIGMFVALMLVVTGSGVGYYFVRMYDIGLTWLGPDKSRWIVDSYGFFKETYPVAAGMVLMSLFAYLIIASAVRRYRYYLDSGQDYRRMVSLAESVDDLTNPAQIARLSDYPELQDVLRNYGDQIREIGAEINEKQDDSRSVDLEMEIDSILKGNPVTESLVDGKWWAPIVRKIETALKERTPQPSADDDRRQSDGMRRAVSRAALACGRIMESAVGTGEEIARIADEAARLAESSASAPRTAGAERASADGIAEHLALLEQVRATLGGFSEQNNGLALNIALMAARGNVDEHQLAQYAENVRMTAERFSALGRDLDAITRGISDACRRFEAQGPAPAAGAAAPHLHPMAADIERRARLLMERVASLVEDAEEIGSAVRSAGGEPAVRTERAVKTGSGAEESLRVESSAVRDEEHMIVNFGSESKRDESIQPDEGLVIDHGSSWNPADLTGTQKAAGAQACPATPRAAGTQAEPARRASDPKEEEGALKISGLAESLAAEHAAARAQATAAPSAGGGAGAEAAAAPDQKGDWMEMPGHRWVQVDAVSEQTRPQETPAEPRPSGPRPGAGRPAPSREAAEEETGAEPGGGPAGGTDIGEEPVYDLYELGAVECVEETEATV